MRRPLLWALDHPVLVAALLVAVTALLAAQIPRLQVDVSAEGAMADGDPDREYYEEFKRVFGRGSQTMLLVRAPDVFTAPVLEAVARLSIALEGFDGVDRVESLTTVRHLEGEGDRLEVGPLVPDPIPTDRAELDRIRAAALADRVFTGVLVSADGRATVITADATAPRDDTEYNRRFSAEVEALIARERAPGLTIHHLGTPFTRAVLVDYIWRDQRVLIPVIGALLVVVVVLMLRTLQGVLIPVLNEGLSVVWTVGLMAVFGVPFNSLTLAIPSILIAVGFCEDVHMLSRYHHLLEEGHDRLGAIRTMLSQTALPVLITTATTVAGFASLAFVDIAMLRQFSYAACLGFTADFLVTVLALPLLLRVLPPPRRVRAGGARPRSADPLRRAAVRIGRWSLDHRGPVVAAAALVLAGSVVGWWRLQVDNDFLKGALREGSVIRERAAGFTAALGGVESLAIVVDTGQRDGVKDPALLRRIEALQAFLEREPGVARTLSVVDYLRTIHREMHGGDPRFAVVPDTPELVAQYLLMIEGRALGDCVDFASSSAQVVVRHSLSGSRARAALLGRIDEHVAASFAPPVRVRYTGEAVLLTNASDYIAINEVQSLAYAFIVIALIHAWMFRSVHSGALSLVPNVVPALAVFGLMGLLGTPLDVGTAPVASVALGIAVDDTVHFLEEYRAQRRLHADQRTAILEAVAVQARPIVHVSVVLALGFGALVLSNFGTLARFGLFSAFVMLMAMACELVVTPVVLSWMPPPRERAEPAWAP